MAATQKQNMPTLVESAAASLELEPAVRLGSSYPVPPFALDGRRPLGGIQSPFGFQLPLRDVLPPEVVCRMQAFFCNNENAYIPSCAHNLDNSIHAVVRQPALR